MSQPLDNTAPNTCKASAKTSHKSKSTSTGESSRNKAAAVMPDKAGSARWKRPWHPRLVLLIAILLPGVGQVLNAQPVRGMVMLFFMLMLAVVCYHLTTPEHSVLGRFAGGWFIYAISIMDAYQWARRRWEISKATVS